MSFYHWQEDKLILACHLQCRGNIHAPEKLPEELGIVR